jgi:hypothetical protein
MIGACRAMPAPWRFELRDTADFRATEPLMREIHVDVRRLIAETPKIKCDGIGLSAVGHATRAAIDDLSFGYRDCRSPPRQRAIAQRFSALAHDFTYRSAASYLLSEA